MPLEERFYNYGYASSEIELFGFTEDTILLNNYIVLIGKVDTVLRSDYYGNMPKSFCIDRKDSELKGKVELKSILTIQ